MIYPVLIDGERGAFGVTFPDLPGCTAMGETVEAALVSAASAAREWARVVTANGELVPGPRTVAELHQEADVLAELNAGAMFGSVSLVMDAGRAVKANMSLDANVLAAIDAAAKRTGRTRSAMVETLAREGLSLVS